MLKLQDLDVDIQPAVSRLAQDSGRSYSAVVSELCRAGLALRPGVIDAESGFPVFIVPPGAAAITPEMVRSALGDA